MVNTRSGFTLLVAVLVVSIVLAIGLSILTITLKEYILSGVARDSAIALNAADAGMECGLYWDRSAPPDGDKFDIGAPASTITCMGSALTIGVATSGVERVYEFEWGTPPVCARIFITKYHSPPGSPGAPMPGGLTCPGGVECTRMESRGYNKGCTQLTTPRTVERGLRTRY
jgi:hypothetical protein